MTSGLGELEKEDPAVYYQKSKSVQDEYLLIELCTEREHQTNKLEDIIREVKEKRRECDDQTVVETFKLFTVVRKTSIALLLACAKWQETFTSQTLRPRLFNSDYIIDKMIDHIGFVNSANIRKTFNFSILRGNPLLLPMGSGVNEDTPIKVTQEQADAINEFNTISEASVIPCYQFLINCLPEDVYRKRLMHLEKWLINPWKPRLWIMTDAELLEHRIATGELKLVNPQKAQKVVESPTASALLKKTDSVAGSTIKSIKSRRSKRTADSEDTSVTSDTTATTVEEEAEEDLGEKVGKEMEQIDRYLSSLANRCSPYVGKKNMEIFSKGTTFFTDETPSSNLPIVKEFEEKLKTIQSNNVFFMMQESKINQNQESLNRLLTALDPLDEAAKIASLLDLPDVKPKGKEGVKGDKGDKGIKGIKGDNDVDGENGIEGEREKGGEGREGGEQGDGEQKEGEDIDDGSELSQLYLGEATLLDLDTATTVSSVSGVSSPGKGSIRGIGRIGGKVTSDKNAVEDEGGAAPRTGYRTTKMQKALSLGETLKLTTAGMREQWLTAKPVEEVEAKRIW